MSTRHKRMEISGMNVDVVQKDIKNLHVGIYPPDGHVRVAAPLRLDGEAIRLAVISRIAWIRRHQSKFKAQQRQSEREMVTGESHYFQGQRYRLEVLDHRGPARVSLVRKATLQLWVRPGTSADRRQAALQDWYRQQLREQIPSLLAKWEPRVGLTVIEVRIKRMKTLWGSCTPEAGRIWLNLELAKKPPACTEYILVHEMIHLLERRHDDRFLRLMDELMPKWRTYREELNAAPLANEEWLY